MATKDVDDVECADEKDPHEAMRRGAVLGLFLGGDPGADTSTGGVVAEVAVRRNGDTIGVGAEPRGGVPMMTGEEG